MTRIQQFMSSHKKSYFYYTTHNHIRLVKGGATYFSLLREIIEKAKHSIYIRMYIWDDDTTGTAIAKQLIEAAKKNVAVYIIADGYASQGLSRGFIRNLKNHGINFRYFEPLLRSSHFYFGRRMHEKLIAVDGSVALIGGINFADRYNDIEDLPAWLDFALYTEGESARQLYQYCAADWKTVKIIPAVLSDQRIKGSSCSVRVCRNDWVKRKHEIWKTYFDLFNRANESITIMCSYFIPGRVLRHRLSLAAKRGVKVKLVLAGPSDVMLAKNAERYLYSWMLKNNIEIYEYQPAVLHAKMMVVDNHWVTIGSYNVNNVSAYASMELNLDVRNKPFANSVQKEIDAIIANDCVKVSEKNFITQAGFFKRLLQKSCYEFIRVVLNLTTFYFKPND
ncbi:MAG: phospholipase D-like domain-containing protein [Flavisolibacter sp.]